MRSIIHDKELYRYVYIYYLNVCKIYDKIINNKNI